MNFKQAILSGINAFGLNRWARFRSRRRLLGLCYHTVIPDDSPADDARTRIAVTVSDFDRQMRELRRYWTPVSTDQVRATLLDGTPLPDHAVHVSFDDGYRNNLTLAAPILEKYDIPATVFITTDLIGTEKLIWPLEIFERLVRWPELRTRYCEELPPVPVTLPCKTLPGSAERTKQALEFVSATRRFSTTEQKRFLEVLRAETEMDLSAPWQRNLYEILDWDGVRAIRDRGIDIGAHTLTHPILSLLGPEDLDRELRGCKLRIDRELGISCDVLAYPFGSGYDYSDRVIAAARQAGFRLAWTLEERRNDIVLDPMRIHRFCVHREHSLASFRCLISGIRGT